ncbi:SMI1/KNR4 family protein [Streptococcus ovuberis]|uniref:SMI1/KNR4 family protein n=1 Tax=Streptococcus ovuberis TaxID=1936207 RepID=A0A7X6N1P0_9STRE|nr:SMI1/KNR4 family protein [Streptococcus ovuberis]NKZ20454.1 SMI1/KNR4 family protein [Streptococcus ovuberis]
MINDEKATSLILENIDRMAYFGNCPNDIIDLAEKTLGIKYPRDYRDFVRHFGAGHFGSSEIYGVFREDFLNSGSLVNSFREKGFQSSRGSSNHLCSG